MALSRMRTLVATQAVRKFTDREGAIDAFDRTVRAYLAGEQRFRVLCYYGIGGIGKTSLLKQLRRRLTELRAESPAKVALVDLDFDADNLSTAADAQFAFRRQWPGDCPLFEFALAKYWANQGRTLEQIRRQVIREDSVLYDLIEAAGQLTDVFAPAKLAKKLFTMSRDFASRHGHLEARFDEIDALAESELAGWLPALLGEEIEQWAGDAERRLVVFVDGHDRLAKDARFRLGKLAGDEWLRELVGAAATGLHVICGRDFVDWAAADVEWALHLESHAIGRLSDADAARFLDGIPVAEAEIRDSIVRVAKGVPLYLDLCASTYLLRKQAGLPVSEADFGGSEEAVIGRFLAHLDREQAEAVRALAAIDGFDKGVFAAVMTALNIGLPVTVFDDFCSASYAEPHVPSAPGQPHPPTRIHAIVQDYLRRSLADDDAHRVVAAALREATAAHAAGDLTRSAWICRSCLPPMLRETDPPAELVRRIFALSLAIADAGLVDEADAISELLGRSGNAASGSLSRALRAHVLRRRGRLSDAAALYAEASADDAGR